MNHNMGGKTQFYSPRAEMIKQNLSSMVQGFQNLNVEEIYTLNDTLNRIHMQAGQGCDEVWKFIEN